MSATLKKTFSVVDFFKKLLTNRFSHSKIKNVSDRQIQNNLCMREWLSWWSTTLPRSGPRVRVPSRALLYFMGSLDLQGFPFFFSYHFSFLIIFPLSSHHLSYRMCPLRSVYKCGQPYMYAYPSLLTPFSNSSNNKINLSISSL